MTTNTEGNKFFMACLCKSSSIYILKCIDELIFMSCRQHFIIHQCVIRPSHRIMTMLDVVFLFLVYTIVPQVLPLVDDVLVFSMDLWYSSCIVALDLVWPRITGKLPGYLSPSAGLKFADVPNGLAAISKVPAAGWGQILAYMAFCEVSQDQSPGTPAAAGDFGFKVLTASDPEEKTKKLSAELANGRLAMMAIIGMFFQAHLLLFSLDNWL